MKTILKGLLLAAGVAISIGANAQVKVDPGVSTHNYKHPAKAKRAASEKDSFEVPTLSEVKKQENAKMTHKVVTPKYSTRHAALVAERPVEGKGVNINPMKSPENYKTGRQPLAARDDDAVPSSFTSAKDSSADNKGL
jgi:hypothetical protein